MKLLAGSNFLQVCLEIGNNIQCRPSLIAPLLFSSFQAFRDKSEITQILFQTNLRLIDIFFMVAPRTSLAWL